MQPGRASPSRRSQPEQVEAQPSPAEPAEAGGGAAWWSQPELGEVQPGPLELAGGQARPGGASRSRWRRSQQEPAVVQLARASDGVASWIQ